MAGPQAAGRMRQAAAQGWSSAVAIVSEVMAPRMGMTNWQALCRGTGFIAKWQGPRPPGAPAFHVVTCGHVAQPHHFGPLYGGKEGDRLEQLEGRNVRVSVQLRGDDGDIVAAFTAARRKYTSQSITEDICVMHLAPESERELFAAAAAAGVQLPALEVRDPDGAIAEGAELRMSAHVILQGEDVDLPVTAADLADPVRYIEILGSMEKRKQQARVQRLPGMVTPPFRLIPTVYTGTVQAVGTTFIAGQCSRPIVVANSGAAMLAADGSVAGMLVRGSYVPGLDAAGLEERKKIIAMVKVPLGQDEQAFYLSCPEGEFHTGTHARRIRTLLCRVEQDLRSRQPAAAA
eukprot:TRINITY_DN55950_c0_g1_i1.p1 TRINITY_DN55950_c0_g1~~TRINITY_DN55950_c0_g1_i1.p1  ORF type:complete len:369 (+),score=105.70 TRINITY_DN55950_c0_g1_i1:67-1107(+)